MLCCPILFPTYSSITWVACIPSRLYDIVIYIFESPTAHALTSSSSLHYLLFCAHPLFQCNCACSCSLLGVTQRKKKYTHRHITTVVRSQHFSLQEERAERLIYSILYTGYIFEANIESDCNYHLLNSRSTCLDYRCIRLTRRSSSVASPIVCVFTSNRPPSLLAS